MYAHLASSELLRIAEANEKAADKLWVSHRPVMVELFRSRASDCRRLAAAQKEVVKVNV